jgi:putative endonuclease
MTDTVSAPHLQRGVAGEDFACSYLQTQGLTLITRNYSCRLGEIDLIMRDKNHLVFVEVRYRGNDAYGGGVASVTLGKQRKLIRSAQFYLQTHKLTDKVACRFDVLAISGQNQVEWIKDAFQT